MALLTVMHGLSSWAWMHFGKTLLFCLHSLVPLLGTPSTAFRCHPSCLSKCFLLYRAPQFLHHAGRCSCTTQPKDHFEGCASILCFTLCALSLLSHNPARGSKFWLSQDKKEGSYDQKVFRAMSFEAPLVPLITLSKIIHVCHILSEDYCLVVRDN